MKGTRLSKLTQIIKFVSIGKYKTPLYYRNQDQYSTVFSGVVTVICITVLVVYAIYDFSAIFNRDHYNFDISGEALEYSGTENYYFETDCAKASAQCVKYTNLDNLNNYFRFLKIQIIVHEHPLYYCKENATVQLIMYGNILGSLKQYSL